MVNVTDKNGIKYQVSLCDDCGDNKGGFYCQVYMFEDDWQDEEIDNFVIHAEELKDADDKYKKAQEIAEKYVINEDYQLVKYDADLDKLLAECKDYVDNDDSWEDCHEGYEEEMSEIKTIDDLVNSGVFHDACGKLAYCNDEVIYCWTEY